MDNIYIIVLSIILVIILILFLHNRVTNYAYISYVYFYTNIYNIKNSQHNYVKLNTEQIHKFVNNSKNVLSL